MLLKTLHVTVTSWTGFQQSLDLYSEQITSKLRDLHSFALAVLPPNRQTVQSYLASPELQVVDLLLASVKQACARVTHFDDVFMKHFLDHVQREEQRLRSNLVSVGFNIDSINALRVVTGPGRLEKVRILCQYVNMLSDESNSTYSL